MVQSRGLSNGKKIREPKLPTTSDILQTRPFAPRTKDVSKPKDTRSFPEKIKGAEFAALLHLERLRVVRKILLPLT